MTYRDPVVFPLLHAILSRTQSPAQRLEALAARPMHAHAERFAAERARATQLLTATPACAEEVRRAAYWELIDNYVQGPGHAALLRLSACAEPQAGALLEFLYQRRSDAPVIAAVAARLGAGDARFRARLLLWWRGPGAAAEWPTSVLGAVRGP
jgi:hypothetical protein